MKYERTVRALIGSLCVGIIGPAHAFVMPYTAEVSLQAVGGDGSGVSDFGLGTSPDDFVAYLFGVPTFSAPVLIGTVNAGEDISFGFRTLWDGIAYEAFSGQFDEASVVAFTDIDNSLGLGGEIIEQVDSNEWILHLDDAASFLPDIYDDDDNDVIIRMVLRPVSIPEPESWGLLLACMGILVWVSRPWVLARCKAA